MIPKVQSLCVMVAPYYNPPDYNPYGMVYTYPTPDAPEAEALNMEPPPVPEPPKPPNVEGQRPQKKNALLTMPEGLVI